MEEVKGRVGGCAVPAGAAVLFIVLACGMPWAYVLSDYAYVRGTVRQIQDAGVLATQALVYGLIAVIVLAAIAGMVANVGLYTRWASPKARKASTRVALARAQHQELPEGLHSYTVQAPRQREPLPIELREPQVIDAEVAPPALPPPPHETFAYGPSRIQQLVSRGDIVIGADQLLVGYDAQRQPRHMRAAELGLAVVAGQSGKGKSSLAGLIIAQAALAGWTILICDPVYHREERSLLKDFLAGMTGAIYRQAVRDTEIAQTIGLAMKIAQRRLAGEAMSSRVLLVVDEFSSVAGRKMLDAEAMEDLFLTATKASAVGVHTLLIAHDLSGSWFGGQAARRGRDQATHRLICNMSPTAAAPILPSVADAQRVAVLPVGQALFFDGWQEPALISFPRLSPADLAWAAQGKPPIAYAPWEPKAPPAQIAPAPSPAPCAGRAAPATTLLDWPLSQRILDLLALHPAGLDKDTIADRLGEKATTIGPRLSELKANGMLDARRSGHGKGFVYTLVRPVQVA